MSMTTTKERPIIFSAPMVRAILAGTKTQTRRIVNGCGVFVDTEMDLEPPCLLGDEWFWSEGTTVRARFLVGQRLWVKETLKVSGDGEITYAADGAEVKMPSSGKYDFRVGTVSSIHMPRWASRITLEITGVRVERVQDIDVKDAAAEGWNEDSARQHPYGWYRELWDEINGKGSWKSNPWVASLNFKWLEGAVKA